MRLILLLLLFTIWLYIPSNSLANSNFNEDIEITYTINNNQSTSVSYLLKITNKNKDFVLTKQTIKTGFFDIKNVSNVEVTKGVGPHSFLLENGQVETVFDNPVIGEDISYSYIINFETNNIINSNGLVKEIYIPKIDFFESLSNIKIILVSPLSLGDPIYLSQNNYFKTIDHNNNIFSFYGEDLKNNGVAVFFGKYQIFSFEIKYFLNSTNTDSQDVKIALPLEIKNKQQVNINKIEPKPQQVKIDEDGNYLAFFKPSKEPIEVKVAGTAKILPSKLIENNLTNKELALPYDYLTKPDTYWESNNSEILKIAQEITANSKSDLEKANKVYDYVIKTLKYDFDKSENFATQRLGALGALKNPNISICMEYSDLTIALLRALNIPARELVGYSFSENLGERPLSVFFNKNSDTLHSWVEFYNQDYGWIQIDPTWGSTSGLNYFNNMDTNHFAFVRRGKSSTEPIPPGAYRNNLDKDKIIEITFGDETNLNNFNVNDISIKKIGVDSYITNNTGLTLYNFEVIGQKDKETFNVIPPFSTIKTKIKDSTLVSFEDFNNKRYEVTAKKIKLDFKSAFFKYFVLAFFLCATLLSLVFLKVRRHK